MKKWMLLAIMALALAMILPAALAADSPVQPVPEETYVAVITPNPTPTLAVSPVPEVTPIPGVESSELGLTEQNACPIIYVETTTDERLLPGIEIHIYALKEENEDENGELQAVVPAPEVTYLDYSQKSELPAEQQEQFTSSYAEAVSKASADGTTLTNFFWIDIPEKYKELLRTKEAYTDDSGEDKIDGEYLELNIVNPGTNLSCTVNSKDMDVIDNKDGTVTLKLTETGAVAVYAEEATSAALSLTADASVPDVIPDPYLDLLIQGVPALAICDNLNDEQQTAVATMDVIFYPVEYISLLDSADQAIFLQAFEDVRDNPTDQKLRNFFWLDLPYHYDQMLSDDPETGEYLRIILEIPGENPRVTVNGVEMQLELIEGTTYAVKLTDTGAIAIYSDFTAAELELAAAALTDAAQSDASATTQTTASADASSAAASAENEADSEDSWYRG